MREEPPTAAPAGREGDAVEVPVPEEVAPDAWHRRVASAVAEGWNVLDLYVCTEQGASTGGGSSADPEPTVPEPTVEVVIRLSRSSLSRPALWLRTAVPSSVALHSIADVLPAAAWEEREAHEMLGLQFSGAADLRPLLLPPDFPGHPLRKDFPLPARVQTPWPGSYEPTGGRPRRPVRPIGVPDSWVSGAPQ